MDKNQQQKQKAAYVRGLGNKSVVTIGNGLNDALMLKITALSIAVIQKEATAILTLKYADIVCSHIIDALELLIKSQRLIATLRK